MKKSAPIRYTALPLLAALIWGSAFVAQGQGAAVLPPFTFSATRQWLGVLALLFLIVCMRKKLTVPAEQRPRYRRRLWFGAGLSGIALAIATNLQQAGLGDTDAGKAGFITALYVVLVPVFGLVLGRRITPALWGCVALALGGLYFLCLTETLTVAISDIWILLCAVFFAVQILLIDHFSIGIHGVHFACVQLAVSATVSTVLMLIFEHPLITDILQCWFPLCYVGVMSSGVAYTLQVVSQQGGNPTLVSLLLCMESVFAVLTNMVVGFFSGVSPEHYLLSGREWLGCALMLTAVILSNLPFAVKKPD